MTETGNQSFIKVLSDLINQLVVQKGGKRGVVKSVDEEALTCTVEPDDKSAIIVSAKITADGKGIIPLPTVGSVVSLIPFHMESEEEGDWGIVQYSRIDKYIVLAETDIIIEAKGTVKIGSETSNEPLIMGTKLIAKLQELVTPLLTHIHPVTAIGSPTGPPVGLSPVDFSSSLSEKVFTS